MKPLPLDERLSLALSLYPRCRLGADIGTDHGLLPCRLLEEGRCQRMILSDISPLALANARALVARRGLGARAQLIAADGLDALTEPVDCVSMMGMGGRTIAQALRRGQSRLAGAQLILSAHTDLEEVRAAVQAIGYHLTDERLCRAGGRWYLFLCAAPGAANYTSQEHTDLEEVRAAVQAIGYHLTDERLCRAGGRWYLFLCAAPGAANYTSQELILGPCLMRAHDPLLPAYAAWRQQVWAEKLAGLRSARTMDSQALVETEEILAAYTALMKEDAPC